MSKRKEEERSVSSQMIRPPNKKLMPTILKHDINGYTTSEDFNKPTD